MSIAQVICSGRDAPRCSACCLARGRAGAGTGVVDRAEQLERAASLIAGEPVGRGGAAVKSSFESRAGGGGGAQPARRDPRETGEAGRGRNFFARAVRSDAQLAGARMNLAYLYLLRREPEKSAADLKRGAAARTGQRGGRLQARVAAPLAGPLRRVRRLAEKLKGDACALGPVARRVGDAYLKKGDQARGLWRR